ncbi:MAG: hypothetical protein CM1200mP39_18410 [Dehalococcoidia bacterium]|nr:MAG: hypothetical protein CM1200mP39_18410 [Dehalococcoidia bacterium]
MGIPVKHSHHEVGVGQHEIDLRHMNALTMADSIITFKVIAKELASHLGAMPHLCLDLSVIATVLECIPNVTIKGR